MVEKEVSGMAVKVRDKRVAVVGIEVARRNEEAEAWARAVKEAQAIEAAERRVFGDHKVDRSRNIGPVGYL